MWLEMMVLTVGVFPWVCILAWLAHGFLRVDAEVRDLPVSVMEGDTVTLLNDGKITQQEKHMWYSIDDRIVYFAEDQTKICTDDRCKERFKDRLKLDQTGSLTITNITDTDSGEYTHLIHGSSSTEDRFIVSVQGVQNEIKRVSVKEGESVSLYPAVPKLPDDMMMWRFHGTLLAEVTGDQSKICEEDQCKERFRDRLKLDHQTGSLIISNTRTTDSGDYTLKIQSNRDRYITTSIKSFSVSVTCQSDGVARASDSDSGLSPAAVAGICAAVVLILTAAVIGGCIYLRRKHKYHLQMMKKALEIREDAS